MQDANALLRELRAALAGWHGTPVHSDHEWNAADELAAAAAELDRQLSEGGPLPDEWTSRFIDAQRLEHERLTGMPRTRR